MISHFVFIAFVFVRATVCSVVLNVQSIVASHLKFSDGESAQCCYEEDAES